MHRSSTHTAVKCLGMMPFTEVDAAGQDGALSASSEGLDSASQEKHVLIVDDDPAILMLVSKMVHHIGFRPKTAVDGLDALEVMEKYTCRLVITDDEMPAMDGCLLAEQIQKRHLGTPVIIMSGLPEGQRVEALIASGQVAGTLLKPFNLNTLRKIIENVTGRCPDPQAC